MPDDFEELGAEGLAGLAKPLIRKKKPALNLSRWKTERSSKDNNVAGLKEHLDTSSPVEEIYHVEELKTTPVESEIERAPEAVSRPRVTFTLPTEKSAGTADFEALLKFGILCLFSDPMYCQVSSCFMGCALF